MSTNYTDTTVPTTSYTKESDPTTSYSKESDPSTSYTKESDPSTSYTKESPESERDYDPHGHDLILIDTAGTLMEATGDFLMASNNF